MLGAQPTIIRVECDACGEKQRLERRYSPGERERICVCHSCEATLKVDLSDFPTRPILRINA